MTTTDPQNEMLTEVDLNNKVIGPISRKEAHRSPGKIYRTIFVLVKNNKGEMLLQKRSATKDLYPNCWDLSVGGHVNYQKTYEETAVKELEEELGIKTSEKKLIYKGEVLVKLPVSNEYFHVFEYLLEPTDKIRLAKEEITDSMWMKIEDLKESMKNKTLEWYPRPLQIIEALY